MSQECFAFCRKCNSKFSLGVVIPCPLDVFIAAGKLARCPDCGEKDKIYMNQEAI